MDTAYARDLDDLRCCSRCLEWKDRTDSNFCRDADGPRGYNRICKTCDNKYQLERLEDIRQGKRAVKPVREGDGRVGRKPTRIRMFG